MVSTKTIVVHTVLTDGVLGVLVVRLRRFVIICHSQENKKNL